MTLKQQIKGILNIKGITQTSLVQQLNDKYPREDGKMLSIQNFNNKISKESITYRELQQIADILGYEICWLPHKE